jgi:hypothetical protein
VGTGPIAGKRSIAQSATDRLYENKGLTCRILSGKVAKLGRAYALQPGALAKARGAYRAFLAFWNDADPELPVLRQARAEFAKLQPSKSAR